MSFSSSFSLLRGSVGEAAVTAPISGSPSLLLNSTRNAISQSFRQIVEGNKGYGGGVVRIDSVEHGPIYQEAFGKVSFFFARPTIHIYIYTCAHTKKTDTTLSYISPHAPADTI
jgi:hypothetical protein